MDTLDHATHIALTGDIVSAYVSNHHVPVADLPAFLRSVHASLGSLGQSDAPAVAAVEKPDAAAIRKSIRPDGLVSFIDGKSYKTLKRHLTANGHTPQSYRATYGLPSDYPLVCPSYAAQRSALAKQIGLGVPGGRTLKAVA